VLVGSAVHDPNREFPQFLAQSVSVTRLQSRPRKTEQLLARLLNNAHSCKLLCLIIRQGPVDSQSSVPANLVTAAEAPCFPAGRSSTAIRFITEFRNIFWEASACVKQTKHPRSPRSSAAIRSMCVLLLFGLARQPNPSNRSKCGRWMQLESA
jgi:hypothetical protein